MSVIVVRQIKILSGQTESEVIETSGLQVVSIHTPAAFTGTALTFKAATSVSGTFKVIEDGLGAAISKVVSPDKVIVLDPSNSVSFSPFLKIISGTAEAADRIIDVVTFEG